MFGPETHGAARWARNADLRRAGMLDSEGVYLGQSKSDAPLRNNGEAHILTVAQPGSGKTAALVLPTLLTYGGGSVVVTDPKGALTAQTARRRRELGNRVVILNPWHHEIAADLGHDLGDTGFNPLSLLRADDPALHDNADMIGTLLCPTPHDARDSDSYWTDAARSILTGCLLYLVHSPDHRATLPALYELVRDTRQGWADLAVKMLDLEGVSLQAYANEILAPLESEKQWAGVHGKILNATQIYAPDKPLGRHVAGDDFDPADLKREDLTVYIVIPSNRREANRAWLALVMAVCAEAVGRPGPARRVLLLAEEFANLGYMPSITRAMAEYREAGLRCWLVIQNLNQLKRLYGQDGAQEILDLCAIRQFFRVDNVALATELERHIGMQTVKTSSESGELLPAYLPKSRSVQHIGVPLIRAQDILNLPDNEQIILASGKLPPVLGRLLPYYNNPKIASLADPNPYRADPAPRRASPFTFHAGDALISLLFGIVLAVLLHNVTGPAETSGSAALATSPGGLIYAAGFYALLRHVKRKT